MERASRVHCKTARGYCGGERRAATENQPGSLVGACAPTASTLVLQGTLLIAEHPRHLAGDKQLLPNKGRCGLKPSYLVMMRTPGCSFSYPASCKAVVAYNCLSKRLQSAC